MRGFQGGTAFLGEDREDEHCLSHLHIKYCALCPFRRGEGIGPCEVWRGGGKESNICGTSFFRKFCSSTKLCRQEDRQGNFSVARKRLRILPHSRSLDVRMSRQQILSGTSFFVYYVLLLGFADTKIVTTNFFPIALNKYEFCPLPVIWTSECRVSKF